MFCESILTAQVEIDVSNVGSSRKIPASAVVNRLLQLLIDFRATESGYFTAVTKIISIGDAQTRYLPRCIFFPVKFQCRKFKPVSGEIMNGIVHIVSDTGVVLKSGPMKSVYLPVREMPNYAYVSEDKVFLKGDMSRIEIGVVVRFVVYGVRWEQEKVRDFWVVASIDGDGLGPVALSGDDDLDMGEFLEL